MDVQDLREIWVIYPSGKVSIELVQQKGFSYDYVMIQN